MCKNIMSKLTATRSNVLYVNNLVKRSRFGYVFTTTWFNLSKIEFCSDHTFFKANLEVALFPRQKKLYDFLIGFWIIAEISSVANTSLCSFCSA